MRKVYALLIVALLVVLTACSAEPTPPPSPTLPPTATMVPEPTATATATPVPYDLSVLVLDAESNPIEGAAIKLADFEDIEQISDTGGEAVFNNLPNADLLLQISAQGYLAQEQASSLERGANQITVTMERDPFGILPADILNEGETILFLEDFQDGDDDPVEPYNEFRRSIFELYQKKNNDYGEVWKQMRYGSIIDIIYAKLLRVIEAENRNEKINQEEFKDIANYSVFASILQLDL